MFNPSRVPGWWYNYDIVATDYDNYSIVYSFETAHAIAI